MTKRLFDIIFAILLLLILSPLLLVICFLILINNGRPIFFIQNRPGLLEKSFEMIKFRTMLILYDEKNSKHVKIWKNFCKTRCKDFIDLFPIFFKEIKNNKRKAVVKKFYLKNDLHFNELGNKKIFNHLNNLKLF